MVHGLETLKALNALEAKQKVERKVAVPLAIALNPALARKYLNRPWTDAELGGKQNVYKAYAISEREPFGKSEGQREGIRP